MAYFSFTKTILEEKESDLSVGHQSLYYSKGTGHQNVTTLSANHHREKYGLHGELSHIHYRERAVAFKGGFSFGISDRISGKLLAGSSTKNQNISPQKYMGASVEAHLFNRKMMFIPLLEKRTFRNGISEYLMALDAVYFSQALNEEGGYFGTQFHIKSEGSSLTNLHSPGIGLGTSFIAPKKYTLELYGEVGETYYDQLNTRRKNFSYALIRPSVDIHLRDNLILLARATYKKTKFYVEKEFYLSIKAIIDNG